MPKIIRTIVAGLCVRLSQVAAAATWYVNGSVSGSGNGQSWETPFKTIQESIGAAVSGDTVIVAEGIYVENLRFPFALLDRRTIFEQNFDSYTNLYTNADVLSAGWEVVNGCGDPNGAWRLWSTTGEPLREENPNLVSMTGNYMIADSDLAPEVAMDEELISPEINCRGYLNVRLRFNKNFRIYAGHADHLQVAEVDIRVLNEATATWGGWVNLLRYDASKGIEYDTAPVDMDISHYADGKKVQIRWHFYEALWDYWFAIDDVAISGNATGCKNITLKSKDPLNPDIVSKTIIDGGGKGSVVSFSGMEDETCVLEGFTIRNGSAGQEPRGYGGGVFGGDPWGNHTHATIRNNVITENDTDRGGGLANCDGDILNNTISLNSAGRGGGLIYCHGKIENNIISDNSSGGEGAAGLHDCDGLVRNNIITNNMASDEGAGGLEGCGGIIQDNVISGNWSHEEAGGLGNCGGTIENNLITGNSSGDCGGGLNWCNGIIRNNTIVGNSASEEGGGLYACKGTILNCIIWGNTAPRGPQLCECSVPTYSCIQWWSEGGEGNIAYCPYFISPEGGDYHLQSWSPCINAGDPSSDFSKEPQPNGGRVNMGAYGNTPEAACKSPDTDSDGLPDEWELHWFPSLELDGAADPDGDGISNAREYRYGSSPKAAAETRVENPTKAVRYQTIQDALCESDDGDEIVVYPGAYRENITFEGRNVLLRSADPSDGSVVARTIIDGGGRGPVVGFSGTEGPACILSGFTIRNGNGKAGGGIRGAGTQATIRNNVVTGNSATEGGGLYQCNGMVENDTISDNLAWRGGGLAYCRGTIRNCIIWGNIASREDQLYQSSQPTYSCIQHWTAGGEGNIADFPHFVDPEAGDYHLRSWSPCADAGDPASDFSREPQPNGGRVNMGAYGNTPEAACKSPDADSDGLPDEWELHWFPNLEWDGAADPDEDGIPNATEYRYGWDASTTAETIVENLTKALRYEVIQAALWESSDGDEIVASPGVYKENIGFLGKNVVLRSSDPSDGGTVASTIIDANGFGSVVRFSGSEGSSCVLSGFTIQNGKAPVGGGICGVGSRATIENNVITGNQAEASFGGGGGLDDCDGTIQNNTIRDNSGHYGGGLYHCGGLLQSNVVEGNLARAAGGGFADCDGIIQNNVITGNSAGWGGALWACSGTIRNNLITKNSADDSGGGLLYCDGRVESNTISGNSASSGGGLSGCGGTITNCIIWDNAAAEGAQLSNSSIPTYSCIQDWSGGGAGNIVEDPQFVDAANADYHVQADSRCIDTGKNETWMSGAVDLDGNRRIMCGGYSLTVDMGAYEYEFPFRIVEIKRAVGGNIRLTWNSRPGVSYVIRAHLELIIGPWIEVTTMLSQGTTTTWTHLDTPSARALYYKIEIK